MRGFLHGTKIIAQEKGIRGFFQGFVPTTIRQGANSGCRFGSYAGLKHIAQGYVAPGEKLGTVSTFGIGALAGVFTVYVLNLRSGHGGAYEELATLPCPLTPLRQGMSLRILILITCSAHIWQDAIDRSQARIPKQLTLRCSDLPRREHTSILVWRFTSPR